MTGPNIDAVAGSDIAHAASMKDLDAACRHLQDIAGITDGGMAGIYFSGRLGEQWPSLPYAERAEHLRAWLQSERT